MRADHRSDIQGLRGIAVLLVVVYHAIPGALSGGFVGVDVFFVISGFVITRMLLRELGMGAGIDLTRFYTRRVRRLLPPLAVMTVTCLALAVVFSPFKTQLWGGRTAAASALFVANWYLWWSGGTYFGPGDEQNPFLHTWSLGIEEQFYVFAPLLLLAGFRRRARPGGVFAFAAVAGASFLLSALLLAPDVADGLGLDDISRFVFFGLPTRLWELCIGVLLALTGWLPPGRTQHAIAVGGMLATLGSAVAFDETTIFPGPAALVPTLGTVALLATPGSAIARLISWRPVVAIGDLSYSWYLWHWPLIVLARAAFPDFTEVAGATAAVIALVPAAASRRVVEEPLRQNDAIVGRWVVALAALCIVPSLLLGLGLSVAGKARWGVDLPDAWSERRLAVALGCVDADGPFPDTCILGDAGVDNTVMLIGDSHAASLTEGVREAAHAAGMRLAVWTMSGCPSLIGRTTIDKRNCAQRQADWLTLVDKLRPSFVVLANRSSGYTLPSVPDGAHWRSIGGPHGEHPRDQAEALRFWSDGMDAMLTALESRKVRVVWVSVVPEFPRPFAASVSLWRPEPRFEPVTTAYLFARRGPVLEAEAAVLARHPSVERVDPATLLCDDNGCEATKGTTWLYMDDHHVNPEGSLLLSPLFTKAFEEQ
jgi:peptidoglycan/LPS O-acetylase OafA/YrhL